MGFWIFWRWKSRSKGGRPKVTREVRDLIKRMARENPTWGAPRVASELLKLGLEIFERTVARYMPKRPAPEGVLKNWMAFLRNHRENIAAMDFFTVPTVSFAVLHAFFVIDHGRRRTLHWSVTANPTAEWVIHQLREAFPHDTAPKYLIFDRDAKFSAAVVRIVRSFGTKPVRTAYRCLWQNPVAERQVGTLRRELLDHVVVLGERHLRRLLVSFVAHHHVDRCHLGLDRDSPAGRPASPRPSPTATVVSLPRVGGLHHRYEWRDAA